MDEQQKNTAAMNAAKGEVVRTGVGTGLEGPEQK